jgi:hypothetical protein
MEQDFFYPRIWIEEMNGRVNLDSAQTATGLFSQVKQQFDFATSLNSSVGADLVRGNIEKNTLNMTFFSPENVQILQNRLQYEVYTRSQGKFRVGPQSADNLLIIMRSIYYQYGKNQPTHIKEQIQELNTYVANFAVPKIISEVEMYNQYRKDITTLPTPMAQPVNISRAGTKSLPLKPFF